MAVHDSNNNFGNGLPQSLGTSGITQLTGDVTAGPGSGSQAATLANTAVTPGSYTSANVTFDSKGRATAASNGGSGVTAGLVLLQTQNISAGDASIDFTSLITSGYDNYQLKFTSLLPTTDVSSILMQISDDNGVTWRTTNYSTAYHYGFVAGSTDAGTSGRQAFDFWTTVGNGFNGVSGTVDIFNPLGSLTKTILFDLVVTASNSTPLWEKGGGWQTGTGIFNAVRVLFGDNFGVPGGRTMASGSISLYGYSK